MKNLIIPVFIPHQGCPHQCVFCNQKSISGSSAPPTPDGVRAMLASRLGPDTPHAIIAFYGGSFTGIPKDLMDEYLNVAVDSVRKGHAAGIRLSTRPDLMDEAIAGSLKERCVVTVELGVQSLDDEVLRLSGRGHTADDSIRAAGVVKAAGLELGIQLMAGLPGDTSERFMDTVRRTVDIIPAFVRIYPAVVVKGSPMALMHERGDYRPLTLDDAVALCRDAVKVFRGAGIRIIRLGLQAGKDLEDAIIEGPYHPAFGHLVESAIAFEAMAEMLPCGGATYITYKVNPAELSVYRGIRSANVERLNALLPGFTVRITADPSVPCGGCSVISV